MDLLDVDLLMFCVSDSERSAAAVQTDGGIGAFLETD
jgi:hypothetical protein